MCSLLCLAGIDLLFCVSVIVSDLIACVASVSVEQKAKNKVFGVLPARKMGREQQLEGGGGGREGRKRLQPSIVNLKYSVGQRTELVIGWAGRTLLTCVNQRS